MKQLIIFFSSILLCIGWGCSKDKGNYSYTDVNTIKIDSVLNEEHNSARIYRVVVGDSINILPEITGSLSGKDTSKLSFAWVIAGDTLMRTKDFRKKADFGFGKLVCNYYVLDHSTGTTTTYNFTLEISNDASRGNYLLTEDANGNTVLITKSTLSDKAPFRYIRKISDYTLGDHPFALDLRRNNGSSSTNYTYTMVIGAKNMVNPVMDVFVNDMLPIQLYNGSSFVDPISGLNITQYLQSLRVTSAYLLNNGKVHVAGKGMIGPVLYPGDPLDYDFGEDGLFRNASLYSRWIGGWDKKNNRMRLFSTLNAAATDNYAMNYDNIIDPALTRGQEFLAGTECFTSSPYKFALLTKSGNTLYSYEARMDSYTSVKSFVKVAEATVPDINRMIRPLYHGGTDFWYFAIGRSIYRSSLMGLDLQLVATLPNDGSGDITAFNFNYNVANNFERMGVATYNPSAAGELKGSYYVLSLADNSWKETYLNVIYRAKEIEIGL